MSNFKEFSFGKKSVGGKFFERTSDFTVYLEDVNGYDTLTKDEEVDLIYKIREGDEKAKERFITSNLRLVVSVVKSKYYEKMGCFTTMDLISVGNIGMIRAIDTFDPTRGFSFATYAVNWICCAINNELKKNSRIVADYNEGAILNHDSLDAPLSDGDNTTLGDVLCTSVDDDNLAKKSLLTDLMRIMDILLKENERKVVCMLFGIGMERISNRQVAERLNKTDEGIRLLKERALGKMRNNQNAMILLTKYL